MEKFIKASLLEASDTIDRFVANPINIQIIDRAIQEFVNTLLGKHKIISCGNGGSMCDAMHFAEELTGRFRKDRKSLPAIAISDPSYITCCANDYGYEEIFSRFVDGFGQAGDTLLAISTSGNSQNIINACHAAKRNGMKIVALTGKDGGILKDIADYPIIVPALLADRIQEVHIKVIHTFIEGIERHLFPALHEL